MQQDAAAAQKYATNTTHCHAKIRHDDTAVWGNGQSCTTIMSSRHHHWTTRIVTLPSPPPPPYPEASTIVLFSTIFQLPWNLETNLHQSIWICENWTWEVRHLVTLNQQSRWRLILTFADQSLFASTRFIVITIDRFVSTKYKSSTQAKSLVDKKLDWTIFFSRMWHDMKWFVSVFYLTISSHISLI